jgi:hypothetical protein
MILIITIKKEIKISYSTSQLAFALSFASGISCADLSGKKRSIYSLKERTSL